MKAKQAVTIVIAATILSAIQAPAAFAQSGVRLKSTRITQRNLDGPRFGITYVLSGEKLIMGMKMQGMGRWVSQFGWHFEAQVIPEGGGPQFVIQVVPLVAGVEYGKMRLSTVFGLGIRFPGGFEFGLGPEFFAADGTLTTALVMVVGNSFNYGDVSIPINVALTKRPYGTTMSFMFGYAIEKIRK